MDAPPSSTAVLDALRDRARSAAAHAQAPYSGREVGAALLLGDGRWVPGVRLESASYPLTIPALLGAYVTAVAGGRRDVRAVTLTAPLLAGEALWLAEALDLDLSDEALDGVVFGYEPLPFVGDLWVPYLDADPPADDAAGLALARQAAAHAWVPESAFRVGCVLLTEDGRLVPGCNVEHPGLDPRALRRAHGPRHGRRLRGGTAGAHLPLVPLRPGWDAVRRVPPAPGRVCARRPDCDGPRRCSACARLAGVSSARLFLRRPAAPVNSPRRCP